MLTEDCNGMEPRRDTTPSPHDHGAKDQVHSMILDQATTRAAIDFNVSRNKEAHHLG